MAGENARIIAGQPLGESSALLALLMPLRRSSEIQSMWYFAKTFHLKYRMFCSSQFVAGGIDSLSWEHEMPEASFRLLV